MAEVKDSTKEHEVDPKLVKSEIEEALKNRKSITFELTPDAMGAMILVSIDVDEFYWTNHDPVDQISGAATIAYDIATVEDYARLQANITVTDVKTQKELWKKHVMATITKKPMSRKDSIPLIANTLAKVFIKECFSKRRSR